MLGSGHSGTHSGHSWIRKWAFWRSKVGILVPKLGILKRKLTLWLPKLAFLRSKVRIVALERWANSGPQGLHSWARKLAFWSPKVAFLAATHPQGTLPTWRLGTLGPLAWYLWGAQGTKATCGECTLGGGWRLDKVSVYPRP